MNMPVSYYIRKYPLLRFFLFFLFIGIALGGMFFFSFSFSVKQNELVSISPQIAEPGQHITIIGKDFGSGGAHSWVMAGHCKIKSEKCIEWSDTKIVFIAPDVLHEDLVSVVVKNKRSINDLLLVNKAVLPNYPSTGISENVPYIEALDTHTADVGALVTIKGKGFGDVRGSSGVVFTGSSNTVLNLDTVRDRVGGSVAECSDFDFDYDSWSDRELRVCVPEGAASGMIAVITDRGASNLIPFSIKHPCGTKRYMNKRTYHVVAEVELSDFDSSIPNSMFLRMPLPQQTGAQLKTVIESSEPAPFIESYEGVSLYRLDNIEKERKVLIRQDYTIERSEVRTDIQAIRIRTKRKHNPRVYAEYTGGNDLLPVHDPKIKKLCKKIVKNERNPYYKARRIYDFLLSDIELTTASEKRSGRTPLQTIAKKKGDAYDLTLLFCTLVRAAGVPAVPTAGLLVENTKKTAAHWWAEFYVNGFGWVPVDPALGAGLPVDTGVEDKKNWYFGNLDAHRVSFSRGYNIQSPMIPGGKTLPKEHSYAFLSIWEETTANVKGYSSFWRLPKVTDVY